MIDRDIWTAANLMVKRHGDDAAVQAAKRAEGLAASGDVDGHVAWKRILAALVELARTEPAEDERVN